MATAEGTVTTRMVYEIVGAADAVKACHEVRQAIAQGTLGVKAGSEALRENLEVWRLQQTALRGATTIFKVTHTELLAFGRVMSHIGMIGRDVVQMFTAWNVSMIRIERSQRDVRDAQIALRDAQLEYTGIVRESGVESDEAAEALLRLSDAQDALEEVQRRLAEAQQQNVFQMISYGLMIPTFIASSIQASIAIKTFIASLSAGALAYTTLGSALTGTVIPALGVGALAFAAFFGTFQALALANEGRLLSLEEIWYRLSVVLPQNIGEALKGIGVAWQNFVNWVGGAWAGFTKWCGDV